MEKKILRKSKLEEQGGTWRQRARVAKQRLRKSTPGAKRRDTVCAEERSTFRKRLCRECVVAAKEGYRHKEVCLPCVVEEKTEIRCMMSRRAEPERHDASSRKSGGCGARILV